MLDAEKGMVHLVVDAFNAALTDGVPEQSKALVNYGIELLNADRDPDKAAMWRFYYLGFGAGCEFVSAAQEEEGGEA